MIGIDFNKASLDIRSKFSFTKKTAIHLMEKLKNKEEILGCVLLSTCNRMELWTSVKNHCKVELYKILCEEKEISEEEYQKFFVTREEKKAVEHLFYLTSGLKSQILAEDQILTQVKDALTLAREVYCTDNVLEVLFRMAVTAAKKVKTEVVFSRANTSVIYQAIQHLNMQGIFVAGKKCMVIGNGQMGRLAALALKEEGADVTVTVRQYKSGVVEIPHGCNRINYGDRMKFLPQCDLVVSATASPNCTITKEQFQTASIEKEIILIDLAVPRDIDPKIRQLDYVKFYDIDSFKIEQITPQIKESLTKADKILQEQMDEFYDWFSGREVYPKIQNIKNEAVEDLNLRITKVLKKIELDEKDKKALVEAVDAATGKVVLKMIFGLRDVLEQDIFCECVEGLKKVYEK